MDQFGDVGADKRGSQQHVSFAIDDQFRAAAVVLACERRSGDLDVELRCDNVEPGVAGGVFGQSPTDPTCGSVNTTCGTAA